MESKTGDLKIPSTRTRRPHEHTIRTADGGLVSLKRPTRGMVIKVMCMECLGWQDSPVDCTDKLCPLWPYRGRTLKTKKGNPDLGPARGGRR